MSSLKKELFWRITTTVIVVFVVIGALGIFQLYLSGMNAARDFIKNANNTVTSFINGYFRKFYVVVDVLSRIPEVRYAPYLTDEERRKVLEIYRIFQEADRDIYYLYSGYENGLLLINDYEPAEGYDPRVRPWYRVALESRPRPTGGIPYREFKTKELLFSVSKVLTDDEGNVTGVISVETLLESLLSNFPHSFDNYETVTTYVLRNDQTIIIHPDESLLTVKISDVVGKNLPITGVSGEIEYEVNGEKKMAYYSRIPELEWIVVTSVDKSELLRPVLINIGIVSIFFTGIISLTTVFINNWFNNKVLKPLNSLKEDVEKIMMGRTPDVSSYPDNEIGAVSKEIYSLTERELYRKNQQLRNLNEKLERLSVTDELTGLFNRRKMAEELEKEFHLWKRYRRPFSLLMIDIDDFKKINDTYGHLVGDDVLKRVARILVSSLRASDMVARWGGEEFLILCPETKLNEAVSLAERIRTKIEKEVFENGLNVTVSIGVCEMKDHETIDDLLKEADDNLYLAKQRGKNRVIGR
ncbi:sensor domain-containing diguanylate cyclase [Thermotoga sp. Mc24]|uniref:sensor domain-containing diguanylate cyclase n=1 Tax=Thermotoga sp. Mc24 TaxID=1231241 RepID=UPI00056FCF3B|nr:sensor domain-containing diguanylate cyclase [Thermotoga sp. Mc24]